MKTIQKRNNQVGSYNVSIFSIGDSDISRNEKCFLIEDDRAIIPRKDLQERLKKSHASLFTGINPKIYHFISIGLPIDTVTNDECDIKFLKSKEVVDEYDNIKSVKKFIDHLFDLSQNENYPSLGVVFKAESFWKYFTEHFADNIQIPIVSLGLDGEIQFSFKNDLHYLEIEIYNDFIEYFYKAENGTDSGEIDFSKDINSIFEEIKEHLLKF